MSDLVTLGVGFELQEDPGPETVLLGLDWRVRDPDPPTVIANALQFELAAGLPVIFVWTTDEAWFPSPQATWTEDGWLPNP